MTLLKHLALSLLIPTIVLAMEPIVDTSSPTSMEQNTNALPSFLVPPQITYYDYVMAICVGNEIEEWGNASGGFGSWLQSKKNAQLLTDNNTNEIILDLPFFIMTLVPVMLEQEAKSPSAMPQLRIDYGMPIPNSDELKGKPTFSLCRMMTEDDCVYVKHLLENQKEQEEAFLARQKQWQEEYGLLTHRQVKVEAKKASPSIGRLFNEPSDAEAARISQEVLEGLRRLVSRGPTASHGLMTSPSYSGSSAYVHGSSFSSSSGFMPLLPFENFHPVGGHQVVFGGNSSRRTESYREHALRDPAGFVLSRVEYGDSLKLGYRHLGNDGIAAITPHLHQVASQVKQLDLERNGMTADGIQSLVPTLSNFINLKLLILCDNPIGNEGLGILAPYLPQLPKLEQIIIRDNNITDSGIIALIPYLPARISLSSIGNFLGNEGRRKLRETGFEANGNDWKRLGPVMRHDYGHSYSSPMISTHYLF